MTDNPNLTPETLNEWLLLQIGDMQTGFDHADAWEAQLAAALREKEKQRDGDDIVISVMQTELAAALRRVEALEIVCQAADDVSIHMYVVDSMGTMFLPPGERDAFLRLASALAALAAILAPNDTADATSDTSPR